MEGSRGLRGGGIIGGRERRKSVARSEWESLTIIIFLVQDHLEKELLLLIILRDLNLQRLIQVRKVTLRN